MRCEGFDRTRMVRRGSRRGSEWIGRIDHTGNDVGSSSFRQPLRHTGRLGIGWVYGCGRVLFRFRFLSLLLSLLLCFLFESEGFRFSFCCLAAHFFQMVRYQWTCVKTCESECIELKIKRSAACSLVQSCLLQLRIRCRRT